MKNLNGPSRKEMIQAVETVSESLHKEKVRSLEAGTQMGDWMSVSKPLQQRNCQTICSYEYFSAWK